MPSRMNMEEFTQQLNNWNTSGQQGRLMTREEVSRLDRFFESQDSAAYQNEGFRRAQAGDFSQYENVAPMLKSYLGARKCYSLYDRFQGDAAQPALEAELKDRLMEADLRAGFALGAKQPGELGAFCKECDRLANRQMLLQTLEAPDPTAKLRMQQQFEKTAPGQGAQKLEQALGKDLEQRVEMAKMLFLAQLGDLRLTDRKNEPMAMEASVAELFTHGGRTIFILPAGEGQKAVTDSIQGANRELSGLKSRSFASHKLTPRVFNRDGTIAQEPKESRTRMGAYAPDKHRGMDVAIGGMGHIGPNGKVIAADGSNGHMYMHLLPGDEKTCGMMMVGFENAGPGKSGRMGHAHGASAKKAGGSAFLSDKSYLGNEMGGRKVDLSGLSGRELSQLLNRFEEGYRNAAAAKDQRTLDACNQLLTGKQMSVGQLKGMLEGLQVPKESIDCVERARAGHPQAKNYQSIQTQPTQPMKLAEEPKKQTLRVTECEGLERPEPPKIMKKPGFLQKVLHLLTGHSKNSYVSRYERYQATLPRQLKEYREKLEDYQTTLRQLEAGEDPKGLRQSYRQAVERASAQLGIPTQTQRQEKTQAPQTVEAPADPAKLHSLEDVLITRMRQGVEPGARSGFDQGEQSLRENIQHTDSFEKLSHMKEGTVDQVLSDNSLMDKLYSAVVRDLAEKNQPSHTEQLQDSTKGLLHNDPEKQQTMVIQ